MLFQMTRTEALRQGYDEALLLDPQRHVAEGSVENIFVVREELVSRDSVYVADEVFFVDTGAEVTPVIEVDDRPIAGGRPGPVTGRIQKVFFDTVYGHNPQFSDWLTPVGVARLNVVQ